MYEKMVFTGFETTKKARYALFFDDEFLFSISLDSFVKYNLQKGMAYAIDYIEEIRLEDEKISCRQRAIGILSKSEQTEYKLREKLLKYFSETSVECAVERMKELGLVDDENYARRYAQDALNLKSASKKKIDHELRQRGISREIIQRVLEDISDFDETENLKELISKKYSRKLKNPDDKQKVIAALMRRGFKFSSIKQAIEEFVEDLEFDFSEEFD